MAADIKDPEVGFPIGEDISILSTGITCEIKPDSVTGTLQETGMFHITLEYENATIQNSVGKSKERLFSICNQSPNEIFTKLGECSARFTVDSKKAVSGDPTKVIYKELHIVIRGEGPKKNSMT